MDTRKIFKLNKTLNIHNKIDLDSVIDMYIENFEFIDIKDFIHLSRVLPQNYFSVYINEQAMFLNTDIGVREHRATFINGKQMIKNRDFYRNTIRTAITIPDMILKTLENNTIRLVNHSDIITIYHSVNSVKLRYQNMSHNKVNMDPVMMENINKFLEILLKNNAGYLEKYLEELKIIEKENIAEQERTFKEATMGDLFPGKGIITREKSKQLNFLNTLPVRTYQDSVVEETKVDDYYDSPNESDVSVERIKNEMNDLTKLQQNINKSIGTLVEHKIKEINKSGKYRLGADGKLYPLYT